MVDYAYTTVPGKIKQLLAKLRTVGVPESHGRVAQNDWLHIQQ